MKTSEKRFLMIIGGIMGMLLSIWVGGYVCSVYGSDKVWFITPTVLTCILTFIISIVIVIAGISYNQWRE